MDYPTAAALNMGVDGKFKDKDAGAGEAGSVIPASQWANPVTDELLAVIAAGGLTKDEANLTQLRDAIENIIGDRSGFRPAPQAAPNMTVRVGSGRVFNVAGRDLLEVAAQDTAVLVAPGANPRNDIVYVDRLTGTVGVETGTEAGAPADPTIPHGKLPVARARLTVAMTEITDADIDDIRALEDRGSARVLPPNHISGFVVTNNVTDALKDLDISAGAARDAADTINLESAAAFTKQGDVAFAKGTNQGGLGDTVSLPASGTIHVHAITQDSTGDLDFYLDTDVGGANGPAGWTFRRRIGSWTTDASSNLVALALRELAGGGIEALIKDPPLDVDTGTLGTAETLFALSVPGDIKVEIFGNVHWFQGSAGTSEIYIRSLDVNDEAPSETAGPLGLRSRDSGGIAADSHQFHVRTNTSSQIAARADAASTTLRIATLGWKDERI